MTLYTLYELEVKRHVAGETDAHGNPVESWTTSQTVGVYSIAPSTSDEPFEAGRNAVVTGLSVLAPVGTVIGPLDRVVWNGEEYAVEGDVADWTNGPFGWAPGIEIKLKRVEG